MTELTRYNVPLCLPNHTTTTVQGQTFKGSISENKMYCKVYITVTINNKKNGKINNKNPRYIAVTPTKITIYMLHLYTLFPGRGRVPFQHVVELGYLPSVLVTYMKKIWPRWHFLRIQISQTQVTHQSDSNPQSGGFQHSSLTRVLMEFGFGSQVESDLCLAHSNIKSACNIWCCKISLI